MPGKTKWIVTTSGERPVRVVADELQKAGLVVSEILTEVGVVTGTAADEAVKKLLEVKGVVDVSPDLAVDIGPPESDESW